MTSIPETLDVDSARALCGQHFDAGECNRVSKTSRPQGPLLKSSRCHLSQPACCTRHARCLRRHGPRNRCVHEGPTSTGGPPARPRGIVESEQAQGLLPRRGQWKLIAPHTRGGGHGGGQGGDSGSGSGSGGGGRGGKGGRVAVETVHTVAISTAPRAVHIEIEIEIAVAVAVPAGPARVTTQGAGAGAAPGTSRANSTAPSTSTPEEAALANTTHARTHARAATAAQVAMEMGVGKGGLRFFSNSFSQPPHSPCRNFMCMEKYVAG